MRYEMRYWRPSNFEIKDLRPSTFSISSFELGSAESAPHRKTMPKNSHLLITNYIPNIGSESDKSCVHDCLETRVHRCTPMHQNQKASSIPIPNYIPNLKWIRYELRYRLETKRLEEEWKIKNKKYGHYINPFLNTKYWIIEVEKLWGDRKPGISFTISLYSSVFK